MEDRRMQVTNAEWKIMDLLWEKPRTITQITAALTGETGWSKHTVITLLKRMQEKDTVYFEEGEKAKLYFPKVSREEAELHESDEFLNKVFHGKVALMLDTMVKNNNISEKDIDAICEILKLKKE
jgi:BlaI family transcriptional regulator, penicillinase repressor